MHIVQQRELWKHWRWLFNGCQQIYRHVLVASPTYAYQNLDILLLVNELSPTILSLKINLKCHKMWVLLALIIVLPTIVLYFLYHHNKLFLQKSSTPKLQRVVHNERFYRLGQEDRGPQHVHYHEKGGCLPTRVGL